MDGILIIHKEKGYTSHDVVARLRGILHQKKIGHTGTLDPDATGVLPVCLGRATKVVELLTDKEKTYVAKVRLGVTTDTQDITGQVVCERPVQVTEEQIRQAAESFLGDQMQIPPMYSALKVNGRKLCDLARQGIEVERRPRPVHFYEIRILSLCLPVLELEVTCSKGTYIRTLCHDLGEKLGCGGCMEELVRTRVGRFSLDQALTLGQVQALVEEGNILEQVQGIESVFGEYPRISCLEGGDRLLHNGNPLPREMVPENIRGRFVRMCDSSGSFVGIYQFREDRKLYFPVKMFY